MASLWLLILWASPWIAGTILAIFGKRWNRVSGWVAFIAVSASALAALRLRPGEASELNAGLSWQWIPAAEIAFAMSYDTLSFPFVVNVLGVSLAAIVYGWGYLRVDARLHLFYALLLGFVGGMLGTLLATDVFLFFVFWESMLVTSSLLLAGWGDSEHVERVVLKYFIYMQMGSLLILAALVVLVAETGGADFRTIAAGLHNLSQTQLNWLTALLTVGFCVKLAVFPLHTWLPDAHSIAPMPVTILLAAAMLSLGAYGILRLPIATLGVTSVRSIQLPVMTLALVSELYGALMCLASRDIKRLVAYSSVSQMGYILFAFASLTPLGIAGGIFHVINHGILKAFMFMGVGLIMRGTGRRQIDMLGGLSRHMPRVVMGLGVGAIAISGVPPFCAFHSEWMIFAGGLSSPYPALAYLEFLVPLFTAAYALWFVIRLAFNPAPAGLHVRRNPQAMCWSFYILIVLALLLGVYPAPVYQLVNHVASSVSLGN